MQLAGELHVPRPLERPPLPFGKSEHVFLQCSALRRPNSEALMRWKINSLQKQQAEHANSDGSNSVNIRPWKKKNHGRTDFRKLTRRVMELAKWKRLDKVFEEIGYAKDRFGSVNIIVMNAVLSACVHCGDVDRALLTFQEMSKPGGCGVDSISFGILLKGLGEAQRLDEAFELLESVERGTALGNPKLSDWLVRTLLNAFVEIGDVRRAKGVLVHFRSLLSDMGPSIFVYNLLIKGYARSETPLEALKLHGEISEKGLQPDRLTYNTLILACVRGGKMKSAMDLLAEMKEVGKTLNSPELLPNVITYTTLLKGFGYDGNLDGVLNIEAEMKAMPSCIIDRVAYTAIIDACLAAGSTSEALRVFGDILEKSIHDSNLRPRAHVYLALMRAFAEKGDVGLVKNLQMRMIPECAGNRSPAVWAEAHELLIEAAVNDGQLDLAKQVLGKLIGVRKRKPLSNRGSLAVVRLLATSGFNDNLLSPYVLRKISLEDPIEKIMLPYWKVNPLPDNLQLCKVAMRFFRDSAVPVTDQMGNCIGIVHREDCTELNAHLSGIMRSPPPIVTSCTSVGRAIALLLEHQYRMIVVVKSKSSYDEDLDYLKERTIGFLTREHLFSFIFPHLGISRLKSNRLNGDYKTNVKCYSSE